MILYFFENPDIPGSANRQVTYKNQYKAGVKKNG